jgi:hypothetical protein
MAECIQIFQAMQTLSSQLTSNLKDYGNKEEEKTEKTIEEMLLSKYTLNNIAPHPQLCSCKLPGQSYCSY